MFTLASPPSNAFAITPGDADLANYATFLYVTGAGNLVVTDVNGGTPVTVAVPANFYFYCAVKRVAAATTATGIVGFR